MREKVYKRTVRRPLHSCVHVLASTSTCNHIMYRRSSGQLQRRFTLEVSCKLIDKTSLNYFRASLDAFPRNANLLAPCLHTEWGEFPLFNFRSLCVHWQIKQTFIKKNFIQQKENVESTKYNHFTIYTCSLCSEFCIFKLRTVRHCTYFLLVKLFDCHALREREGKLLMQILSLCRISRKLCAFVFNYIKFL